MQQNIKNIVIYVVIFVLCLFVGFGVTGLLKPSEKVDIPTPVHVPVPPTPDVKEPQYFSFSYNDVRRETHKGNKRGLKSDTIMDVTYEIIYTGYTLDGDTLEKNTEIKELSRKIIRIDKENLIKKDTVPTPVPARMTVRQFESMLNNLSDNILEGVGNNDVSGAVRITVRKQKEGGKKVRNVRDVREKIETGLWFHAKVLSLGSDSLSGKIFSAVVEPIYQP